MSEEQFREAWIRWRTAREDWESKLTAGQLIAIRDRDQKEASEGKSHTEFLRKQRLPEPADGYSWKQAAAQRKLDTDVIKSLETQKVAFGDSVRQSFEPYLVGPVFVTSDSVLNGFHVLFEDSFREIELRQAVAFRADFEGLLAAVRKLPKEQDVMAPERAELATRHLQRVLGPALVLCGTPLDFFDVAIRTEIQTQVDLIRKAENQELPAWLAPADPDSLLAIDYRRCQPVGFYAASGRLDPYYRATRWLQMVPFRASREHEFDAMVLLALVAKECGLDRRLSLMACILGRGDDPSPLDLGDLLDRGGKRKAEEYDCRRRLIRMAVVRRFINNGYYRVNSDLRARRTVEETFSQLTFRVVPQVALPDAVLFQELCDRSLRPSGLAVAAMLGSSFAVGQLDRDERAFIGREEAGTKGTDFPDHWLDIRLYHDYLDTLRALFQPPADDAPDFMKGEVWAVKSCQTALGGWAQIRHTFTLQAKAWANLFGLVLVPPGFVEPNPEFYARLARLSDKCERVFSESGAFLPSPVFEADRLRDLAKFVRSKTVDLPAADLKELSMQEYHRYYEAEYEAFGRDGPIQSQELSEEQLHQRQLDLITRLEKKADAVERGGAPIQTRKSPLRDRWRNLARIARTLETLAHKQLRRQPWTVEEANFLRRYGEEMAGIMGYDGNSWLGPRDDAARWAEVGWYPERDALLAVGVGRPRNIYVLYPWNGMEILCVGSVMQYFEYEGRQRLSDKAWTDLLDSSGTPPVPAWMRRYVKPPGKPVEQDE